MEATWQNRLRLKREAGVSMRGRDNKNPALHLTLSWHAGDHPTPEHMKETALSALKAIGLEDHQVLMAAHEDKNHLHVHMVINTVHPETGRTAPMKYTKERLSRWAEAYEKEHGIHCEQRIENNEKRDRLKEQRQLNANEILTAAEQGRELPARMPYAPIKDHSPTRSRWFKTKELEILTAAQRSREVPDGVPRAPSGHPPPDGALMIDAKDLVRLQDAMRQRYGRPDHDAARRDLEARHDNEHAILAENTVNALRQADKAVSEKFRPRWRDLYREQEREIAYLENTTTHHVIRRNSIRTTQNHRGRGLMERAVYVYRNRDRLGSGTSLNTKQVAELIRNPDKLMQAVKSCHTRERQALGSHRNLETRKRMDKIRRAYDVKRREMTDRHDRELVELNKQQRDQIGIDLWHDEAQKQMAAELGIEIKPLPRRQPRFDRTPEQDRVADQFKDAAEPAPLSRAEQIRRDMEAWRRRNRGRDFGRDLE